MAIFERSLEKKAQQALSAIIDSPAEHWWKDLLSRWKPSGSQTEGLRLALRKNYFNFYLRGQSVGRVGFDITKTPYVETHAKYAFAPDSKTSKHIRLSGNEYLHPNDGTAHPYEGGRTLEAWMLAADGKKGDEKSVVDDLISANSAIIDFEMALPAFDGILSANRIDLVALEPHGSSINIVFWEVKLLEDSRLVAREKPKVLAQLKVYRDFLSDPARQQQVIVAYVNTCKQMLAFHEMAQRLGLVLSAPDPMVAEIARNPAALGIDAAPRLLIHGDSARMAAKELHLNRFRRTEFGSPTPLLVLDETMPLELRRPEMAV